jgi:hypothetical protein
MMDRAPLGAVGEGARWKGSSHVLVTPRVLRRNDASCALARRYDGAETEERPSHKGPYTLAHFARGLAA